jgi:tyrosyl-tRNA synthetase
MDQISKLLTRGIANIIPGRDELEKVLRSGRQLNAYLGIDPTATHIHLGHATHLRRLQKLAELGHNVTFLIGDFTAMIGDTSDKDKERPVLTPGEIEANWQTYKSQAEKIIDFSKVNIRRNSKWLKKLGFEDTIKLTRHFSLNDFNSRELIKKRLTDGSPVSLPEVLYPIMQGYDSYFMDTDIQLGGPDQTFNMQAGRTLQKDLRGKESFVLVGAFLEGTDGRKMSKSWGNAIWLDDSPNDIYGKVMSIKDDLINRYFLLATSLPEDEIPSSGHPMDLKKLLAHRIVTELHSREIADTAQTHFESVFQRGQTPSDIPAYSISAFGSNPTIVQALAGTALASSNSEARRLIDQGGVAIDSVKVSGYNTPVTVGTTISVGSRKFAKIIS